jgi:hypothetical protein
MTRAFVVLVALVASISAAHGERLTRAEYARAVAHAADGLAAAAESREAETRARDALSLVPLQAVVADGGAAVSIDNRELVTSLRRRAAAGRSQIWEAEQALRNLDECLSEEETSPPADAQSVLASVLARREFRPSRVAQLRQRIYQTLFLIAEWLLRRLASVNLHLGEFTGRVLLWTVLGVTGAIVLYLVARLILTTGRPMPAPDDEAFEVERRGHSDWLAEAEARLGEGDYRAALRALHMAALLRLDEAGVLTYDPAAADGWFVRALRRQGPADLASALSALSQLFSLVWYGNAPAGPGEYRRAQESWRQVEALTAR